jgi:hypothetical protein
LQTLVGWTENPAIKKEPGAVNHISVVTNDRKVLLTINDQKILDFIGVPPEGGGLAGLEMGSAKENSGPAKFTFANFQVRKLAE